MVHKALNVQQYHSHPYRAAPSPMKMRLFFERVVYRHWKHCKMSDIWCRYRQSFHKRLRERQRQSRYWINIGAEMSPCLTPLLIDISSDRVPLKLTLAFIPLWRERIRPTNLLGKPNFSNIFQRVDLLTVSKPLISQWNIGTMEDSVLCTSPASAEHWKSYPQCHGLHENCTVILIEFHWQLCRLIYLKLSLKTIFQQ